MSLMFDAVSETSRTAAIETARLRSLGWLATLQVPGEPRGVMRISAAQDHTRWPGVSLYGTYNGIMCLDLIGGLAGFSEAERTALVTWLEAHRRPDGIVRVPGMTEEAVFKKADRDETWRYIDFHVTNYTLGALDVLDPGRRPNLAFVEPFLDPLTLKAWLADRDLNDPWQEGNNIVNLAGFFLLLRRDGDAAIKARVDAALEILYGWHDRNREPSTGFWGVGQLSDATRLLHAFAGSMHNFHIWYHEGRIPAAFDRSVNYVLSLPPRVDSACIDVDAVDVLVHGLVLLDYRRDDICRWLSTLLDALLADQNGDGGFCDVRTGTRRQDGWVRGYEEPQGLSNTFATWFRWITIAMIADVLFPGRWNWRFRRMIGIGYRLGAR
ncbi:hypothetical protein B6S44_24025 [Bosea sp. Tri-44]|uniref:hypothetical protein n=1 Tax=Bosea sp. Tri-44 TaxID=1972137 RepID=UPI00100FA777|nr:hypothetical protein [Bosea sp. Tri-44]RXT48140.1 hypothetical protein B6S44_24025 [Bosea sp. Tri-44]